MKQLNIHWIVAGLWMLCMGTAQAAVMTFASETDFQNALTGGVTVVNLDAAPLNSHASGYHVEDAGPAADFAALGVDFQTFNASVVAGQAIQISKPGRDRLILNGAGFGGTVTLDLLVPANGIGVWSNNGDGGTIRAYDGPGLTGNLIGSASLGSGTFGGLISSDLIRSVEITCDFNADLKCGLFDIQHGTVAPVPLPAGAWLLMSGLPWLLVRIRRR